MTGPGTHLNGVTGVVAPAREAAGPSAVEAMVLEEEVDQEYARGDGYKEFETSCFNHRSERDGPGEKTDDRQKGIGNEPLMPLEDRPTVTSRGTSRHGFKVGVVTIPSRGEIRRGTIRRGHHRGFLAQGEESC